MEQFDAAPVPARRLWREIRARPFVVEPPSAGDLAAVDRADHVDLRPAVVVARCPGAMALAAEAVLTLQDYERREQCEIQIKIRRRDACLIAIGLELELPVVDPDTGTVGLGVRQGKAGARRALIVHQPAALRIRQRSMREQDLARVEAAGIRAFLIRPRAEKRD